MIIIIILTITIIGPVLLRRATYDASRSRGAGHEGPRRNFSARF
jgi:preprotein translocase subunit SecG